MSGRRTLGTAAGRRSLPRQVRLGGALCGTTQLMHGCRWASFVMLSLHLDASLSVLATQSVRSPLRSPYGQLRMQMLTGTDSCTCAAGMGSSTACSDAAQDAVCLHSRACDDKGSVHT